MKEDYEPDGLVHTAQEPASVTYKEVQDSMNSLEKGNLYQQVIAEELGERKLYTTPPQRPWVGLTDEIKEALWEASRAGLPRFHTYATLIEKELRILNT